MNQTDNINVRKQINNLIKQSKTVSKPSHCILCKQPQSSFCNSHVIPQMVLRNIATDGKVLHSIALVGLEAFDIEKGIKNAGTFHFICRNCDNTIFQDYENPELLLKQPNDKMMAEIALKNVLLLLSKRNEEVSLYDIFQKEHNAMTGKDVLDDVQSLDIRDYLRQLDLYKNIIENNSTNDFQILFWKKLPFVTPIAVQTPISLYKDMNGEIVNDVYDLSPDVEMKDIHLCVFPFESETIVLLFYHRRDKIYRSLRHQFNSVSEEKCLEFINYLVFEYSETYFCSKSIENIINENQALRKVSQESNGYPNLGYLSIMDMIDEYEPVKPNEIPNFLTEAYKIR